jgi:phospholipase C
MENEKKTNGLDTFDHVVVLMLENRSFDNLLGYLYKSKNFGHSKTFDGLNTGDYPNPVPSRAIGYDDHKTISPQRAKDYSTPYPDPGEEYQHVNSQIYNHIDPDNIGVEALKMKAPYNLPSPELSCPPMNGFVNDYESNLQATYGEQQDFDQYEVIMQCFEPDQLPVMATLATQFAVFDHWHCSVPSQTYCNRSFWHAATSGGKVINPLDEGAGIIGEFKDMKSWAKDVWPLPTIFDRMNDKNISWKVYSPTAPVSATNIIHGLHLKNLIHTHEYSKFLTDLSENSLPQYSFVEPQFLFKHNDQHPSSVNHKLTTGTVKLGENLILEMYEAIRLSKYKDKTLFIITHDEHGGCFDHVCPPKAIPPVANMEGQLGFKFDRLGIRVPMIMISSHIHQNTVVNELFDHTSFIKTICEKWQLEGLTDRDKSDQTNTFSSIFSDEIREWPRMTNSDGLTDDSKNAIEPDTSGDPLNGLQKALLIGLLHLEKEQGLGNTSLEEIDTIGKMMEYIKRFK